MYSFSNGILVYHQIKIALEDQSKTTFVTEWGFFQYTVMPFGLKKAPTIFSHVGIMTFKVFVHKFMEVNFDDLIVFGLVKRHVVSLHLMLDTCQRYQIKLSLKKCIFYVPFGIILSHVVCKHGLKVDLAKITVIVNLESPRNVKQLRMTLGHTRYYRKFIKQFTQIPLAMEKLSKKM